MRIQGPKISVGQEVLFEFSNHAIREFFRTAEKLDGDIGEAEHPLDTVTDINGRFKVPTRVEEEPVLDVILEKELSSRIFLYEKATDRPMSFLGKVRINPTEYNFSKEVEINLAALSRR